MIQAGSDRFERPVAGEAARCGVEIAEFRAEMLRQLSAFRVEVAESESRAMRWMLIASIANAYVVLAILFAFFGG